MTRSRHIFGWRCICECSAQGGVKPIVGCELSICKRDRSRITRTPPDGIRTTTCWCLAENEEVYRNLVRSRRGFATRVLLQASREQEVFGEHSKGLIGLSGCLKGEVAERLTEGTTTRRGRQRDFTAIFSAKKILFEIRTRLEMEHRIHSGLFQLEKDLGLPLVATNDSHYLCEDDAQRAGCDAVHQTGKSFKRRTG